MQKDILTQFQLYFITKCVDCQVQIHGKGKCTKKKGTYIRFYETGFGSAGRGSRNKSFDPTFSKVGGFLGQRPESHSAECETPQRSSRGRKGFGGSTPQGCFPHYQSFYFSCVAPRSDDRHKRHLCDSELEKKILTAYEKSESDSEPFSDFVFL